MAQRVLIVDDDAAIGGLYARILSQAGYEVETTAGAEDGLRRADESAPDLIIVDFRMPMINGVGFLYRLRERDSLKTVPVAMITGQGALSEEVLADLRLLGADLHYKPIAQEQLLAITKALLLK